MKNEIKHTPRGLVIELSVKTEEAINLVLAKLLGIIPEESKSFGITTQALSFNAKANLLLDLNQLDKLHREKFQIFMEIRNKFAHINSIDTFEKCFTVTNNYKKLKKIFEVDEDGENLEEDMETMFCILSLDISATLRIIKENLYKDMAVKYTQRRWTQIIKEKREEYIKINPLNAQAVEDFITYIKNILQQEVDDKIENRITPHI
ncbi:hypothetical protein H4V97_000739 [Flavobacterium sp. CG_23.5]|uniref:hypothetical protein n=1 Tax=unclassified Flavobacterium TaxID=196869 RepID=UPI0018C98AB8|nr:MULTISPECIES: hypothetical protein [unclassified Flavobacterium]MBG6111910.1 hypothetical protein [Flavobacterium sp. CG_9.10]MBP2282421.1 hypothetical protein [Flavobacterium sp. CG_23.5]